MADITIERQQHLPGEATIPPLPEHILTIHIGQPHTALHRRNGRVCQERIVKGHIALTPAGELHGWRSWDSECDVLLIRLKPEFLAHIALKTDDVDKSRVELLTNFSFRDAQIEQIGLLLWSERQFPDVASQLYTESLKNILAVHLLRNYCTSKQLVSEVSDDLSRSKLQLAIDYINDNLEQDLTLAEIAATIDMSHYHFARLFKQATGVPPHQYILQCRINCAKELLSNSNLSLVEITFRLGFNSQSHFTATFRKLTKTTPKAYREEQRIFASD